jgi:hypothetical protein
MTRELVRGQVVYRVDTTEAVTPFLDFATEQAVRFCTAYLENPILKRSFQRSQTTPPRTERL